MQTYWTLRQDMWVSPMVPNESEVSELHQEVTSPQSRNLIQSTSRVHCQVTRRFRQNDESCKLSDDLHLCHADREWSAGEPPCHGAAEGAAAQVQLIAGNYFWMCDMNVHTKSKFPLEYNEISPLRAL